MRTPSRLQCACGPRAVRPVPTGLGAVAAGAAACVVLLFALLPAGCGKPTEGASEGGGVSPAATVAPAARSRSDPRTEERAIVPPGDEEKGGKGEKAEPSPSAGEAARARAGDEPPVLVEVGTFRRGPIRSLLRVHADLEAVERASVYPEISGIVMEVLAREGDAVEKGQTIIRLVDHDLRLAADIKKTLWDQSKTRVRQAELAARELEQTVRTKELLAAKAAEEFERMKKLYSGEENGSGGIISKEEYDAKRYDFEEARVALETARIQLEKAKADTTLARQTEEQSRLEYETARFQLSHTELTSPIDGRITSLELRPGELVGPTTMAFSVLNPEKLEARLFVPQRELARLDVGQPVILRCQVFPDAFDGVLDVINPAVDSESGMVRVIVSVTDPDAAGFLKPGMFVNGEIVLETRENALLVSKKAILYENQQPILFLVNGSVARRYTVEPGYSSKDELEIRALVAADGTRITDLPGDAQVVLQGHNSLKDGSRVEIADSGS